MRACVALSPCFAYLFRLAARGVQPCTGTRRAYPMRAIVATRAYGLREPSVLEGLGGGVSLWTVELCLPPLCFVVRAPSSIGYSVCLRPLCQVILDIDLLELFSGTSKLWRRPIGSDPRQPCGPTRACLRQRDLVRVLPPQGGAGRRRGGRAGQRRLRCAEASIVCGIPDPQMRARHLSHSL